MFLSLVRSIYGSPCLNPSFFDRSFIVIFCVLLFFFVISFVLLLILFFFLRNAYKVDILPEVSIITIMHFYCTYFEFVLFSSFAFLFAHKYQVFPSFIIFFRFVLHLSVSIATFIETHIVSGIEEDNHTHFEYNFSFNPATLMHFFQSLRNYLGVFLTMHAKAVKLNYQKF